MDMRLWQSDAAAAVAGWLRVLQFHPSVLVAAAAVFGCCQGPRVDHVSALGHAGLALVV